MLPLTSISGRFLITILNNDFTGSIEHLTQSDKSENNDNAS